MSQKNFFAFLVILAIIVNVFGIFEHNFWLAKSSEFFLLFSLVAYYYKDLPLNNFNFYSFLACVVLANTLGFIQGVWYLNYMTLGLWLASYVFMIREAIKFTEYAKGSRFMTLYFLLVVAVYTYLLSLHILELERSLKDGFEFWFYIIYYLNLLILAVFALIYYLNSFSRKSVFFMCLAISFIFADVFRDMEVFYFPDLSVEMVGTLIRFAGLKLALLFFVTREKKLRLLHLV